MDGSAGRPLARRVEHQEEHVAAERPLPRPLADRTARRRHHPGGGAHQLTTRRAVDPGRLQPRLRCRRLRLAPGLLRALLLGRRHLGRPRHRARHRAHRAAGPGLAAHRDQPVHQLRRLLRRPRPADRLGRRPAAVARLHRAGPVGRRRRGGRRTQPDARPAHQRRRVRRHVQRAGRAERHRGGVRVPAAAEAGTGPDVGHGRTAAGRAVRLRAALRRLGARHVPARRLLADLAAVGGRRRTERPDRLHHPAGRLHPVRLARPVLRPAGAVVDRRGPVPRPADPAAVRHLHRGRHRRRHRLRARPDRRRAPPGSCCRCWSTDCWAAPATPG